MSTKSAPPFPRAKPRRSRNRRRLESRHRRNPLDPRQRRLPTARARYRIYVIDEVHMLTIQAFNALLKTLEEPPPHVKFIFATTEFQTSPKRSFRAANVSTFAVSPPTTSPRVFVRSANAKA
jgi:DNA polymerase III delta prime subunit